MFVYSGLTFRLAVKTSRFSTPLAVKPKETSQWGAFLEAFKMILSILWVLEPGARPGSPAFGSRFAATQR